VIGLKVAVELLPPLLLQLYVLPPLAVSVVLCPAQIEFAPPILAIGFAFTVTDRLLVAVHPLLLVTVTIYVVFVVGLTVIAEVVAPVLQA
jgi:hypothetical protein